VARAARGKREDCRPQCSVRITDSDLDHATVQSLSRRDPPQYFTCLAGQLGGVDPLTEARAPGPVAGTLGSSPRPAGHWPSCRPVRHDRELNLAEPKTWPEPQVTTVTQTTRYGTAVAQAWDRLHPRLTHRAAWEHCDGELPVIEGTLIRLQVSVQDAR
jgi:hypothetical protein